MLMDSRYLGMSCTNNNITMEGIKRIGEIDGVILYFDKYVEKNNFLMGRKSKDQNAGLMYMPYLSQVDMKETTVQQEDFNERLSTEQLSTGTDFIIGSTMDIEKYKKALEQYRKNG